RPAWFKNTISRRAMDRASQGRSLVAQRGARQRDGAKARRTAKERGQDRHRVSGRSKWGLRSLVQFGRLQSAGARLAFLQVHRTGRVSVDVFLGDSRGRNRKVDRRRVALKKRHRIKSAMKWRPWAIGLIALSLVGCGIGRVVTAPVRYVFNEPEPTPVRNTSDVTNPGRPLPPPSPTPRSGSRTSAQRSASAVPRPGSSPAVKSAVEFPVAQPVPGRPGLVFNPFKANGGYIDVSGYAPGSKVKDPDSQKIFIVP